MTQHTTLTGTLASCLLAASLALAAPLAAQEGAEGSTGAPAPTTGDRAASAANACANGLRYTFSWNLQQMGDCALQPRGGTSEGLPVTLDPEPSPGWLALQEPGLDARERDRRAILAMAGPYRTSFEFLETVGYTPDFERSRPYQSWGTEYVYVLENSEDFISLQHIMVMFMRGEDGAAIGPIVQKHWRQDWQYEKPELLVYAGNEVWEKLPLSEAQYRGTWAQSVYQVDDSPRYESYGRWQHQANFSSWQSASTWRPLPRRESSVRDDYQVLEGFNRHSIVPSGWVHEEENLKLRLTPAGAKAEETPYLAKELGLNRYERIVDFDFSAGNEYWQLTSAFWEDVRAAWQELFDSRQRVRIVEENAEGLPLFVALFEAAERHAAQDGYQSEAAREDIREILEDYVE